MPRAPKNRNDFSGGAVARVLDTTLLLPISSIDYIFMENGSCNTPDAP